jgi:hypothetical protein
MGLSRFQRGIHAESVTFWESTRPRFCIEDIYYPYFLLCQRRVGMKLSMTEPRQPAAVLKSKIIDRVFATPFKNSVKIRPGWEPRSNLTNLT